MNQYDTYKPSGIDWIGDIPSHWDVKKLKYPVSKIDDEIDNANFLIAVENIQSGTGKLVEMDEDKTYQGSISSFREGDVIFNKLRPYLAKVYYAQKDGGCFGELLVLRGNDEIDQKYLFYRVISQPFIDVVNSSTEGTKMPRANWDDFIKQLPIALPPLSEQAAIASFLDEKTDQLDTLIDHKRRLIDLLREEKTALINEAVTKGISPDVPMKESDIEWLGEVPAHWILTKIGYLSTVVRGASPRPAGDPKYFNGDHTPWITVAEVTKDEDKYITSVTDYLTEAGAEQSRFIEVGTLLLSNSGATLGVPKILKIGGCINDGSVAFLNLSDKVTIDFVYYFFKSLTYTYRELMKGSGQPNLNTDIVKSTAFGLPSLEEQLKIAQHIDTETAKIDHTVSRIEREIELMQEYRTALISEVVTGKVKVI